MSYTAPTGNEHAARTPVLVVTAGELHDYLREIEGVSQDQHGGYSEEFTYNKTDFATAPGGAVTASRLILGGDVRSVLGWACAETTNAATASFRLHDGSAATNEVFARVNLAINESNREEYPKNGMRCYTGRVFLEIISGSVEGVLYWR